LPRIGKREGEEVYEGGHLGKSDEKKVNLRWAGSREGKAERRLAQYIRATDGRTCGRDKSIDPGWKEGTLKSREGFI